MIIPPSERMSDEEYLKLENTNDEVSALIDAVDAQKNSSPNYWSVVPAFVRYNKSLTWFEKILYSELSALSNKYGYCFAQVSYFTKNFGNSERTVQVSLSHLAELGFISFQNEVTSIGTKRKIFVNALTDRKNLHPLTQESAPPNGEKQPKYGVDVDISQGKAKGNSIISNSNSISISKDIVKDTPAEAQTPKPQDKVLALPSWMGKSAYARLVKLYEMMWAYKMGTKPNQIKPSSAGSGIIKTLLKKYTEELSALIIVAHFEWRGANGSDNGILERMKNQGFPITWILNSAPMYESFIKNYLKINSEKDAIDRLHKVLTEISNAPEL